MSPQSRLLAYVRLAPYRYLAGAILTLAYVAFFQLIPLTVRRIVAALDGGAVVEATSGPIFDLVWVSALFAIFRYASRVVMFRIGRQTEFHIRNDYFSHLQRLPQSFFNAHRTGDLMSRAVNDINSVRLFLGMGLLNLIQTPVLYLGAVVVMLGIDPALTFWALLPFPLFIGVARIFGRKMFQANLAAQEQLGHVSTAVQENASGVLVVKTYDLAEQERARFARQNATLYERMMRVGIVQASMFAGISLLPAISSGLVLLMGGRAVEAGTLGAQDLWVFWVYIGMLTFPTMMLGFVISITQRGLAALERLGEILDTVPSIQDREDTLQVSSVRGDVRCEGLSFCYPGSEDRPALDDVDFAAEAGQTIGIVGPVGSGKSTLVSVIPRLLEVPDGTVFIDDRDLNRLPVGVLRSSIAMVPQDSFLFSTTLKDNIRFGCPDASLEEVRAAARRAHVLRDIEEFPEGFETVVGERGITLSGGQRQRVALARALILRPSILILDDSLSSVDHETEEGILEDLKGRRMGRTCFIVAHRISAVRQADQILVLEEGRITERGTHEELVALDGFYSRLYRRQELEAQIEEEDGVAPTPRTGSGAEEVVA